MPVQEPPIEHTRLKSPRNRTMPVKYRDYDMDVEGLVVNNVTVRTGSLLAWGGCWV